MNAKLLIIILWASCFPGHAAAPAPPAAGKPACCADELEAKGALPDRSLYQIDSSWKNDAGAVLKLASLRGQPVILTLFFASCEYACPLLVHDMKRIEAALPEKVRTNVAFVLVSIDPERDTPEALAAYRKKQTLPANWTLLHGEPSDVLELAALLGVKFRKDSRGQFSHSNIITVLNSNGEIVMQQTGLHNDPTPAATALENLLPRTASHSPAVKTP